MSFALDVIEIFPCKGEQYENITIHFPSILLLDCAVKIICFKIKTKNLCFNLFQAKRCIYKMLFHEN